MAAVEQMALDLYAEGTAQKEVSRIISSRFGMDEAHVDAILIARLEQYKRGYFAQQTGMKNAIALGQDAMRSVLEDCR